MADLISFNGGKITDTPDETIPVNDYVIVDIDNDEFEGTGFCIFTAMHIAIMRDDGKGAIPVLVVPLGRVKALVLNEDEVTDS